MSRLIRRIAAVLAVAALAFAQLAVSAYACPVETPPMAHAATSDSGCDRMVITNLCDRHCDYGSSTVQNAALDFVPQVFAVALPWRIEADLSRSRVQFAHERGTPAVHSPPLLLLFGTLRI